MKVLVVTPTFPPLRNGTARLVGNLAGSLNNKGHSVTILTRRTEALPAREDMDGMVMIRVPASPTVYGKISFFIQCMVILQILVRRRRVDVVHAVGTAALASSVLGTLGSIPIILTFPGLPAESTRTGDPQRVVKTNARMILRILSLFPRFATVPTGQALSPVIELCGRRISGKIRVISNPMDLNRFSPTGSEGLREYFPEMLVVGGLRSRKGAATLIRALPPILSFYPNPRVTLVGTGSFAPALDNLSRELGVAGSLRWTGEVSDERLVELYQESDVVVVPSLAGGEAFGYVVAEAMCMKRPVIASATPGPSEIIRKANSGLLFPPGDSTELTSAILRIARDENQRRLFGENGRKYAEEHFDSKKVVAEFESLYTAAILKKSRLETAVIRP